MLTISAIKQLIAPICKEYGVEKAYLFGSYARGEETESSDVDLRIEPGKIRTLFLLGGFWQDVSDALQKEVDIMSSLPDSTEFRNNLAREELLLYEE